METVLTAIFCIAMIVWVGCTSSTSKELTDKEKEEGLRKYFPNDHSLK